MKNKCRFFTRFRTHANESFIRQTYTHKNISHTTLRSISRGTFQTIPTRLFLRSAKCATSCGVPIDQFKEVKINQHGKKVHTKTDICVEKYRENFSVGVIRRVQYFSPYKVQQIGGGFTSIPCRM